MYPESRPKGKTEEEARKEMRFILKDRKENWMRRPDDPDQRFGASSLAEWKTHIEVTAETAKMPDLAKMVDASMVFSNDLIDEVNQFDRAAIVAMAKAFKA